jgi:hypothetical protein
MKTNKMQVSDVFQRVNKVFLDTITKNLHNNSFYYSVSPKNKGKTNAAIIPPNTITSIIFNNKLPSIN